MPIKRTTNSGKKPVNPNLDEYITTSTGGMPHKQHRDRNVQLRPKRPAR